MEMNHDFHLVDPYKTLLNTNEPGHGKKELLRFEDAEVSKPDVQRIIDASHGHSPSLHNRGSSNRGTGKENSGVAAAMGSATQTGVAGLSGGLSDNEPAALPNPEHWTPPHVSPALARFKHSWEAFIDTLMREWKTFNVVSALLLSYVFV